MKQQQEVQITPSAVRDLRKHLGFTQEQFARELGVTMSTVSRWETGRAQPSGLARQRLPGCLGNRCNWRGEVARWRWLSKKQCDARIVRA
ncbi:MAG: helix-turn-helix domain-containing protein [Polyangia bacterium]